MADVLIGVDLGGTKIRAARLDRNLNILHRQETLTLANEGLQATLGRIKQLIHQVMPQNGDTVLGIGISAPGPLNPLTGVVVAPPNLMGWHNVPLGDILHQEFGLPVYVGNDANVAALAEAARGAAHGYRHSIYITISTGIGSGMLIDGRLLLGTHGLGAEAGHMIMLAEAGHVSSLEREAAGPALARQCRARIEKGEASQISELVSGNLDRIDAQIVGAAADRGDKLALDIVRRGGWIVGLGIVTLLHVFNPQIVVIGGGVSNMWQHLITPLWDAVKNHALDSAYWEELKIERAVLGDNVSIIGAAALVVTRGGQDDVTRILSIFDR